MDLTSTKLAYQVSLGLFVFILVVFTSPAMATFFGNASAKFVLLVWKKMFVFYSQHFTRSGIRKFTVPLKSFIGEFIY